MARVGSSLKVLSNSSSVNAVLPTMLIWLILATSPSVILIATLTRLSGSSTTSVLICTP
jgi:hypothetical protein